MIRYRVITGPQMRGTGGTLIWVEKKSPRPWPPAEVGTLQVAPTILRSLGLDPAQLDGVRLEGTRELPAVQFGAAR